MNAAAPLIVLPPVPIPAETKTQRQRNPAVWFRHPDVPKGGPEGGVYGWYGPGPFFPFYHKPGEGRVREKLTDRAEAKKRAQEFSWLLYKGELQAGHVTAAERAEYVAAKEEGAKEATGVLAAVTAYVRCLKITKGRCAPEQALEDWARTHPAGLEQKPTDQIIEEYLAKCGLAKKTAKNRRQQLEAFHKAFPAPLSYLTPIALETWLDDLKFKGKKVSPRTRRNYRDTADTFLRWCRKRRYLAKEFDPLESVSDPDPGNPEKTFYTVEEWGRLLSTAKSTPAREKLFPLIILGGLAGIRHEEILRLLWTDIDWETNRIKVRSTVAKTKTARIVQMSKELVHLLKPYSTTESGDPKTGPICVLKNSSNALCRLRKFAGITGNKRNALRKTFQKDQVALSGGDYQAIAYQAGTSKQMMEQYYVESGTKDREEAQRRKTIKPTRPGPKQMEMFLGQ